MTLYDMLDKTMCGQPVWILAVEGNGSDRHMEVYKGTVDGARLDDDEMVWDLLFRDVTLYEYIDDLLVIRVKKRHYKRRFEEEYSRSYVKTWTEENHPWLTSYDIHKRAAEVLAEVS